MISGGEILSNLHACTDLWQSNVVITDREGANGSGPRVLRGACIADSQTVACSHPLLSPTLSPSSRFDSFDQQI